MYFHPTVVLLNNVDELLEKIQNRIRKGVYKHYKGKLYEVLGVGHHSETLEELVFYHAVGENRLWVRLKKMFFEMIEVNGKKVSRFNFIANKL
ncbi:MAG: DUF1653 domain-containing protein [Nanoarchaeota archaeon]|nr:DUF1653 domain-containing protein [Nanoarchaeota archaeon]